MVTKILLPLLLFTAALAFARDKPENWIEVRTCHFDVVTNSTEKQGRWVADRFERMRSVVRGAFSALQSDSGSPIVVLAIKNERDFRSLEPEDYLGKGQLRVAGLFLHAPDKNYVLMQLDAAGDHPYAVIYHEYTHLLLVKEQVWLPLWLNEGLAQFYENTEIGDKGIVVGIPSNEDAILLQHHRLLPLATLFTVDRKSPYYHKEDLGSIFYAESWALTHYLLIKDYQEKTHRLRDYAELLVQNLDPVTAAIRVFGDLQKLQSALDKYVQQKELLGLKLAASSEVDDSAFKVHSLAPAQADALRADFLASNQRTAEARSLLDHVFGEDPNNVSAHETMGFLELRQGHLEEARKWYAKAVQLDSQSYLAHYYFAAISMRGSLTSADESQVENSLRTAIRLNSSFAPAFDSLAMFLRLRHRDLNEAHMLGLTAVSLDPGSISYRVNVANILLDMKQGPNAVEVLRATAKLAKTPQEVQTVNKALTNAQEYIAAQNGASIVHPSPPGRQMGAVDILSDTQGVDFGPYLQGMLSVVRDKWYRLIPDSARLEKGKLAIEFTITKDGKLADMRLVTSSGDEAMDRAAWGSITSSSPFPSLPAKFNGPSIAMRLRFYYNPDERDLQ
ncbi:MAG TPA: TonB family protein [Candidatus Sulfotelmatobacter sp.]|nr:TonB family protein [Candidatus Sulfotelmatobacter sp.]